MKSESFVSVVLVHNRPLATLENTLCSIQAALDERYSDYEVVVIGQGTRDVFTLQDEAVLARVPSVRYIQLSATVQKDVAWAAALENAIGDFVVKFDPIADPVGAIGDTVAICKSGFDVVIGVATQSRTLGYRMCRAMATRMLTMVDYSLPRDATGLACVSRRAVNAVTCTGRCQHQLFMRIQRTGYPLTSYKYTLLPAGRLAARSSLLSGIVGVLRLMVFNSSTPLRWMSGLGLFGSAAAFAFGVYSLLAHVVKGNVVEGWTTTILFMSALFMMQFVIMAFFGEYLGRLLESQGEQGDYSVVFERTSKVMVNQDRINVMNNSLNPESNRVQTGRAS
jgi:hypothetical protein